MGKPELFAKRRKRLMLNRSFLKGLYEGSRVDNKCRIQVGTKFQLNNLLVILGNICKGDIPIRKEDFEKIKKARRIPHLYKLRDRDYLIRITKGSDTDKKRFLTVFTSLFKNLLFPIFNKTSQ